jgi:type I restriction enzyme S subunit
MGDFVGGGTPKSSNSDFWNGTIPWVSSSDLLENNIYTVRINRFITDDAIKDSATKICAAPVILIVSRVGIGKVAYCLTNICTSQDFVNIVNFKCDGIFLTYLLSRAMKRVSSVSQGTSIKGISSAQIKAQQLFIPKKEEQVKIGQFLKKIDERIQTQNKIIEELRVLKRNVAYRIFNLTLNIGGQQNSSRWKVVELREMCTIIGGGTPQTTTIEYWNGSIQWFTPSEIKGNYVSQSERTITEAGLKNSSAKLVPKGTILLTTRATIGEVAIALVDCSTNQGFQSLLLKPGYDKYFLFNWLKENKSKLRSRASGSTFPEISKSELEKLKLCVPELSEQTKIGNILKILEDKVDLEYNLLQMYVSQRKYLTNRMFI